MAKITLNQCSECGNWSKNTVPIGVKKVGGQLIVINLCFSCHSNYLRQKEEEELYEENWNRT